MNYQQVVESVAIDAFNSIVLPKFIELVKQEFEMNTGKGKGSPSQWLDGINDSVKVTQSAYISGNSVCAAVAIQGQEYILARVQVIAQGNNHRGPLHIQPSGQVWNHEFTAKKQNPGFVYVHYDKEFQNEDGQKYTKHVVRKITKDTPMPTQMNHVPKPSIKVMENALTRLENDNQTRDNFFQYIQYNVLKMLFKK